MFEDRVEYECVRPDHLPQPASNGREITIHKGCWAHCPAGADGGHEWQHLDVDERAACVEVAG